ncbi:hypothetical protein [Mesorhizobium sp. M0195]|uniref:hypothetical protein n=1 Tax=unclassified Mesorhizobium TaxID=325217 RepID=UPI00333BE288
MLPWLRRGDQDEIRIASPWNTPDRHCPLPHHNVPHDRNPDQFVIGSIAGSNCIAPNTIACAFSFRQIFKRRCKVRSN